jgi:RimJ/RimL family protein N-acetyltransferase
MQNPFAVGRKVYLRPLERDDAGLVQPWLNDPEVTRTMRTHGPLNLRFEEAYIERMAQSQNDVVAVIMRRDVDAAVGLTGLHGFDWKARHAVFGITIGDKGAWGLGLGTEATYLMVRHAFETLNLNRVELQVYESNPRGLHVYEKVGFKKEGVLRQHGYREGRYWDTVLMGILRPEWDEVKERLAAACLP